jgi:hypothetical protein
VGGAGEGPGLRRQGHDAERHRDRHDRLRLHDDRAGPEHRHLAGCLDRPHGPRRALGPVRRHGAAPATDEPGRR